jgi:hypothetical protein
MGFALSRMVERAGREAKLAFKAHPHMLRHDSITFEGVTMSTTPNAKNSASVVTAVMPLPDASRVCRVLNQCFAPMCSK